MRKTLYILVSCALFLLSICTPVPSQSTLVTAEDLLLLIQSWKSDDGMDLNSDGITDKDDLFLLVQSWKQARTTPPIDLLTRIASTSPGNGEDQVAITRETIIRFSTPVTPESITPETVFATFSGETLDTRIHISEDARTVTLFYSPLLPASAQIRVTVDGDQITDEDDVPVDADGDGLPGGVVSFDFQTLSLTILEGTIVCGRVFASQLAPAGSGELSMNEPLEGVTVTVDGMEDTLFAVTDEFGNFRLEPAPAGEFFVHIDGRTATNGVPEGAYYPFVGKSWVSVPSEEVNIGNIYLPLVSEGTLQPVSAENDTVITFVDSVLEQNPELEGVAITVPANSLFSDTGERGGMVGIAPVPPDRLPGELPEGLDFPIVITVQTDGPTNFDEPAPICLPNLPDPVTGEVLSPGDKSALWSFNHDTGRFEIVGPMTVSADGQTICTDPGVGILAPGWHGTRQGVGGRGGRMRSGTGGRGGSREPGSKSHPRNCPGSGPNPCPQSSDPNIDPVYLFSGEFYLDDVDLEIPGRGFNFIWGRKYRSQIGPITEMGHSWDWSYNISLGQDGDNLVLLDGNTRTDEYTPNGQGVWTRGEFFNEIVENPDGTYTLYFPDSGRWNFLPFDDGASSGKISSMSDRNGNEMQFQYDEQGRLIVIIDTLDRPIGLEYNEFGFISAITDFAGRTVQYEYYDANEEGGNFGNLKSVTSPRVTDTPNGNDFPDGKTITYTYSTGFDDERLNHNLLTITDGRRNDPEDPTFGDGPFLVNVYAETTNEDDLNFDRIVRQVWGGGTIDLYYEPLIASPANGNAVLKSIMNDRNGNVKEYFWDERNRGVRLLEYTGRAIADEPTTLTENRPTGKLRESDPDYFDTRYEWNDDSQLKRTIYPNGNIVENVYESELNPDASPRSRGNIRVIRHLPGTHRPIGDQDIIEEFFEYDTSFGNTCCGFNFITRHIDGIGNETLHTYDDKGNRIRTRHRVSSIVEEWEWNEFGQPSAYVWPDNGSGVRQRDEYTYYTEGPQRGYMERSIQDAENLALTTTYEYDLVGNVVRMTDPSGHDDQFIKNALNQTVRHLSRETTDVSGVRYQRDYFFDANNNIARVDVQNVDDSGTVQPNSHFTTVYEYEILDSLTRITSEVDAETTISIDYAYDSNRNRILTRQGEAVAGRQPENIVETTYDERDLMRSETRAPGTPEQSTTRYSYDLNGNNLLLEEGIEDTPRITQQVYDSYNRVLQTIDPMGNVTTYEYDANHNRIGKTITGELADVPGQENNVRLFEQTDRFDAMDRVIAVERAHFNPVTQEAIGDGVQTIQYEYNANSKFSRLINANNHASTIEYDSVNRRSLVMDAKGNTIEYAYDENSNLISKTETDRSDTGSPDQVFMTTYRYDNLDRRIGMTDAAGNVSTYGFDSRYNLTLQMDGVRSAPDAPGNVVRHTYDGLSRLLETRRPLTDTGLGDGTVIDELTTRYTYDDSSRLTSITDDNGNATRLEYDPLDRRIQTTFADGTTHLQTYDVHSNVTEIVDANGTRVIQIHDLLDRLHEKRITPGDSVSNETTNELFGYDGLWRMRMGQDDDSLLMVNYDSIGNVISETLNGQMTTAVYDAMNNKVSSLYPSGTSITRTYDELEQLESIRKNGTRIAAYQYVGANRFEQIELGNGTRTRFGYNGVSGIPNADNDFGQRLINRTTHSTRDGRVFDDRSYTWNQAYHKTRRQEITPDARNPLNQAFSYDSTYRMQQSIQSDANGNSITISYNFDGAGNRIQVSGGDQAGTYTMNESLPEPADMQVNQYTATAFDSRTFDANGNLLTTTSDSSSGMFAYNYRNQMVSFTNDAGETTEYRYDVLGRRIQRTVGGDNGETILYFYDGDGTVCEEQNGANELLAIYVAGRELDDVVLMERFGADYYYHTDDMLNVVKLTSGSGEIIEQYEYSDYGSPSVFDPDGNTLEVSAVGNSYLFNGRRYDPETGFYYYRNRYLDPDAGRFTTRDPIGMWGDINNLGNGYTYVSNDPWTKVDPLGLRGRERTWWDNFKGEARTWGRAIYNVATDSSVREAAGYEFATNYSDNARAFLNQSTFGLYEPDTIYNRDNYIKAQCRARCFWVKYADTVIMNLVGDGLEAAQVPLGVVGLGSAPLEPVNAAVLNDRDKLIDRDPHDLASSAAGLTVLGAKGNELAKQRHFGRNFEKMMNSRTAPTKRQMAEFNKRLGKLNKAQKLTRGLNKVAGVLAVGAMLFEVNDCRKDCDKNPCKY